MKQAVITAVLLIALLSAGSAVSATGNPLPTFGAMTGIPQLDSAASDVAGHPVTVECVFAASLWLSEVGSSVDGSFIDGFTTPGAETTIHLGPAPCDALYGLTTGDDVGAVEAARGLLTLAHEAVHQRGVTDEGVTDCTALPLVPGLATKVFGIPATVVQTVTATRTIVGRIGKRSKRVRVSYVKTVGVPNPYLAALAADAERWHRLHLAAYQGTC